MAPIHVLLQIWGRSLQLYPPRWVGWGQRTAELSPQDTPSALSKACHHLYHTYTTPSSSAYRNKAFMATLRMLAAIPVKI